MKPAKVTFSPDASFRVSKFLTDINLQNLGTRNRIPGNSKNHKLFYIYLLFTDYIFQ
jgi:hypothetical protein